jgi:hypothetical protein
MASSSRGLSPRVCRTFSDGGSCVEKAVVHDQKGEYPKEPEVIWILGEILRDFPAPEENNALPSENSALDA